MEPKEFKDILYEKDDQGIVTVTLNTPSARTPERLHLSRALLAVENMTGTTRPGS